MNKLIINILLFIGVSLLVGCSNNESVNETKSSENKDEIVEPGKREEQLKLMNNVYVPGFIDISNNKKGDLLKVLIIGNSITFHGKAKNIGWNFNRGMAASNLENDYVHKLFSKIETKSPNTNLKFRISNLATFEREPSTFNSKTINAMDSLIGFNADVIVFQLGENVGLDDTRKLKLFEEKYVELVKYFKKNNAVTILTTSFFPSAMKNKISANVAISTRSHLADLSHLPLSDNQNYAKDENNYNGDRSVWKVDGIGIHPGDVGMENIANQIFIEINASSVLELKN